MAQSEELSAGARQGNAAAESDNKASALYETAYPKPLRDGEEALLQKRPKWQGRSLDPRNFVGFGLSGGGIRSATFCLGVFQGLAELHLLGKIDYISSVSGGSYFASFYGRLFTRRDIFGLDEIEKILSPNEAERMSVRKSGAWKARIFDWMRDNGRYLAPKGGGDLILGIAVFLRNWLMIQLIMATAVLALFLAAQLLRVAGEMIYYGSASSAPVQSAAASTALSWSNLLMRAWNKFSIFISNLIHRTSAVPRSQGHFWCSPFLAVAAGMALLWVLPLGWAYWLFCLPEPAPQDPSPSGGAQSQLASGAHASQTGRLVSVSAASAMVLFFGAAGWLAESISGWRWVSFLGAAVCAILTGVLACLANQAAKKIQTLAQREEKKSTAPGSTLDWQNKYIVALEDDRFLRCDEARNWTSAMLRTALTATVAMLAFGIVDSAGQMLYARHFCTDCYPAGWLGGFYGALAAAAPFVHWVTGSVMPKKKQRHLPMSLSLLAGLGAALVIIPTLIGLDMFSHAIAYGFQRPSDAPPILMLSSMPVPVEILRRVGQESSDNQDLRAKSDGGIRTEPPAPKSSPGKRSVQYPNVSRAQAKEMSSATSKTGNRGWSPLAMALLIAALFSWLVGGGEGTSKAMVFLNRTSLHALYTARLIRAYLGASNKSRYDEGRSVSDVVGGDDISQERYWFMPEEFFYKRGAPLHLVNMTLTETIDGESQIEQRDRKGLGMASGPSGLSVGVRHHAIYLKKDHSKSGDGPDGQKQPDPGKIMIETFPHPDGKQFRVFGHREDSESETELKAEKPSVGNWTGISGAAASTGMGFRTSLGLSLLTGFFNVRLGYWWDSGIEHSAAGKKRAAKIGNWIGKRLPAQGYLVDEFLARFHGTSRRYWYLSDGGNFENLGGYELIRRRLPLIVIIDAAADPNYEFEDLAGLVRKARLDFNAEIEFLENDAIKAELKTKINVDLKEGALKWYGPLEQLRRGKTADEPATPPNTGRHVFFKSSNPARYSFKHAALARIRYLDEKTGNSFLILVKPTLVGDEPDDVLQYHSSHPSFPHESTAEQFFDEEQWESYRRLGQHIAKKLFAHAEDGDFLRSANKPGP